MSAKLRAFHCQIYQLRSKISNRFQGIIAVRNNVYNPVKFTTFQSDMFSVLACIKLQKSEIICKTIIEKQLRINIGPDKNKTMP